jgi:hypothetical protein
VQQFFRQTQHRSVEKGSNNKELAELKKQNRLLERKNRRLMKELSKAVDIRHGFEDNSPDQEESLSRPSQKPDQEVQAGRNSPERDGCPQCGAGLRYLQFTTPGGAKSFVVCTCGYRAAA